KDAGVLGRIAAGGVVRQEHADRQGDEQRDRDDFDAHRATDSLILCADAATGRDRGGGRCRTRRRPRARAPRSSRDPLRTMAGRLGPGQRIRPRRRRLDRSLLPPPVPERQRHDRAARRTDPRGAGWATLAGGVLARGRVLPFVRPVVLLRLPPPALVPPPRPGHPGALPPAWSGGERLGG